MRVLCCVVVVMVIAAEARAQEPVYFNERMQGGPYKSVLYVKNDSCPGAHSVQVTVQGAPWYRITGENPVRVPAGDTEIVQAQLDLTNTPAGPQTGTVVFKCLDCPPGCKQSTTQATLHVTVLPKKPLIEHALIAGSGPVFGGTVNGMSPDICIVIRNILKDLGTTAWGKSSRGQAILNTLNTKYADNDCSDFTFVSWSEVSDDKGVPSDQPDTPGTGVPKVNEGAYEYDSQFGIPFTRYTVGSEEITIALDQRVASIMCAKQDPSSYYLYTHKGKLGVAKKSELVHLLIHEGLHATVGGKQNVSLPKGGFGASLEEEQDGAEAGHEACRALGLPKTDDSPNKGYKAPSDPNYRPLK